MSYELAKAEQDRLWQAYSATGKAMDGFPRGAMGLIPDEIKATLAYRIAHAANNRAFQELRNFNARFSRQYKQEIRAAHKQRNREIA